jgi:transcription initiation factor TFIIB
MNSECPQCGEAAVSLLSGPSNGGDTKVCEECGHVLGSPTSNENPASGIEHDDSTITDSGSPWSDFSTVSDGTEANIASALAQMDSVARLLSLSEGVRKHSAELYAEAMVEDFTEGRKMKNVVAACVRTATHKEGEIYPDSEIVNSTEVDYDTLKNTSKALHRKLEIPQSIPAADDYLTYLSDELGVDKSRAEEAVGILQGVDPMLMSGKSPISYAAACLYLVSKKEVTQREVAVVAGITTETVRVRLRELEEERQKGDLEDRGGDY